MANCLVTLIAGRAIEKIYFKTIDEMQNSNFENLDLLHHLTASLKAFCGEMVYIGIDELRQSCGGAGFLLSAGIADWWTDISPFPTYEGPTPVMTQQSARLIFKNADRVAKGKPPLPLFSYLVQKGGDQKSEAHTPEAFSELDHLERTLAVRAAYSVTQLREMMMASKATKKEKENEIFQIEICQLVRLHIVYIFFRMAKESISQTSFKEANLRCHLETACQIFALKQLILQNTSLYEAGYFTRGSSRLLALSYEAALRKLRPQMVAIVECFPKAMDHAPTTIGNAFGDIYEMQFEAAKNSSLNKSVVPTYFETHMKPVMNLR